MRVFLKHIASFCLFLLVLAILADVCVSRGLRKTERGHFYTMNALMNERMDADIVIIGNSRAACSYNPMVLDTVLDVNSRNLGVSGQPFGVSWLRWQLYRRNNVLPELLIVNIDYSELNLVTNGFEKEQYYPYLTDTLVKPYLDLYGLTWAEKHVPMYRYRGDPKLIGIGLMELLRIRHDTKGHYYKGYSNYDSAWNGERLEAMLQKGSIKDASNEKAVGLLEDLLVQARNDNLPVVFVYAPLYKKLKDNLDERVSRTIYQELSSKYDIPIIDLSGMSICSDTDYFKDANHLNSKGAELFSVALSHSIDSLGILNNKQKTILE